jgi:hypothetical protein
MDELKPETKLEIARLVFPDLRYGGDPDVERYFEFRKAGRVLQALAIYNDALRARYPDDASRVALLKLYREGDPRYAAYQESLLLAFAERLAERIRRNIDVITAPLERADLTDALRALKAVESVLSRLPGDGDGALALMTRYERFARALGHRQALAGRALELVREYDAVSRSDSPSDYDFVARSAAIEERRRAASKGVGGRASRGEGASREEPCDFVSRSAELEARRRSAAAGKPGFFDPARIKFSESERTRVEISPELTRREDRTLAFCAKYWPLAGDAAFERIVFLYSRKFGGRHFEVFRAIKSGRERGASDDDILSSVAAILTTGYSYSVSGDLYMQVMWRRLRARMEARAVAERLAAPGPVATTRVNPAPAAESRVRARRAALEAESSVDSAPPAGDVEPTRFPKRAYEHDVPPVFALKQAHSRGRAGEERLGLRAASRAASPPVRRVPAPEPIASPPPAPPAPAPQLRPARAASPSTAARPTARPAARGKAKPSLSPAPKLRGQGLLGPSPARPEPMREIKAKRGSISDHIRKLSGRNYDVYRQIFLESVRDHIRRALLAHQTRSHGIFDTAANDAEDQVYGFMAAHYDDPFMDWERSAERDAVEALGFSMPSLAPVIEACFGKLRRG